METEVIDIESLKFFTPFQSLSDKQLDYIAVNAQVVKIRSDKTIIDLDSKSSHKYLLLEGSLKLRAFDGSLSTIEANTERAKNPVAQLRPSRYHVSTSSPCKILVLKEDCLNTAIEQSDVSSSFSLNETVLDDEHEEDRILYELILELQQGNFVLPSLPHIAMRIREIIADENSCANDIAKVIMTDPAIAAKIIKAANSALYQRHKKAEDCKTAVVSLGTKVTTQLVTAFTLKELFKTPNEMLKNRMKKLWEHSIEIASISYVLAKVTPGFNAEHAMLAGLIHDIGNVAILNKAQDHPLIMDSEKHLDKIINKMHAQVGSSILRRWDFSEDFIKVVEETENWMHDDSDKSDLVDIINMAHLHSYIGSPKQREVPIIDQTPAFHKLALGKLTPKLSIKVLEKANEKIEDTKSLLSL
ncbi:MAG: HDOD domain-containing protein [gamma proteobacterium symbiont of Bathyaustriella thionipta]|nr:HDOD domain-containing protein [gamma proteobacterium symbiont of Bathyaustriella thionipta]MCU7950199.1 HDOD domain-containing protein [gamma proteobacterium symbiont of Bathyaustriella thionipta]MCU7953794.1 HDOD domain-containing protein [gamma proteobacterium symbiont of Bathyaustriella thionipta]MCU7956741.1 HDOD domain-containing protein [gamma proteobacterium symbiont of Bathyaustriella thionipta]MCU7968937.1 HDOD domain-containing protein [gamma proteobacterium symbiont of Bathyaustr